MGFGQSLRINMEFNKLVTSISHSLSLFTFEGADARDSSNENYHTVHLHDVSSNP